MAFQGILFDQPEGCRERPDSPSCFSDLNLDQIVKAVTAGKADYNLQPFFNVTLNEESAILYRQDILKDLEKQPVFSVIQTFADQMKEVRKLVELSGKLYYHYNKEGWFLQAVRIYCHAVSELARSLCSAELHSDGLKNFCIYINDTVRSESFRALQDTAEQLNSDLSAIRYCILIRGNCVRVQKSESEPDYSQDVAATFDKFRQGAVKDYRITYKHEKGMNSVESRIVECIAKLYPEIFTGLDDFCTKYSDFQEPKIRNFDREIQFYVAYLEYIAPLKQSGLEFCYPAVLAGCREIHDEQGFDLLLAKKLLASGSAVVTNDFELNGAERALVISGPNQGGKTTFARAFGQIHYLAALGYPVPGRSAKLLLFDRIYTHFEREEEMKNLSGKLQDDLIRIHAVLKQATANSIIIMNEIFSSTTLQDAILLGKKVMEQIRQLGSVCVFVTFIDEMATLNDTTVSMVSTIVPDNPTERTYRIIRKAPDGLAYALSIAEKYRLTDSCIKERIQL